MISDRLRLITTYQKQIRTLNLPEKIEIKTIKTGIGKLIFEISVKNLLWKSIFFK